MFETVEDLKKKLREFGNFWERRMTKEEKKMFRFLLDGTRISKDWRLYQHPLEADDLECQNVDGCPLFVFIDLDENLNLVPDSLTLKHHATDGIIHKDFEAYEPINVVDNVPPTLQALAFRKYMTSLDTYFESEKHRCGQIYDQLKGVIKDEHDFHVRTLNRQHAAARKLLAAKKIRPNMKKSLKSNLDKIKAQLVSRPPSGDDSPGSPASLRPNLNYDETRKPTLHDNYPGGKEVREASQRSYFPRPNKTRKLT
jgi:hypothetical protein